jgi:signal transduction histidine kinase
MRASRTPSHAKLTTSHETARAAVVPGGELMFRALKDWLIQVPIAEPVERKSAAFLQLVLAYEGVVIPCNKLYRRLFVDHALGGAPVYPSGALLIDNLTDVAMTLAAWIAFVLVRKGQFRNASRTFLGTMFASMLLAYGTFGYAALPSDETIMEVLVLAALLLGKRALWTAFGVVCTSLLVAMTRDAIYSGDWAGNFLKSYNEWPSVTGSYLATTIILNQLNSSLRAALAESEARGRALRFEVAARERQQEALVHTRKMEAVGQLASGVAHDFNNVLGVILGFARERRRPHEVVDTPSGHVEAMTEALEGIEIAAEHGAAVSERLLSFSRREQGGAEILEMEQVCKTLASMLRQLFPPNIRVSVVPPMQKLFVRIDRNDLDLAVLDVAANARDAMPEGGEFSLSVKGGATVLIECIDTGTGIDPEILNRIVEPFFTTKARGHGTGLGLATVYGTLRRAGGDLRISSTPGRGTRVCMHLPHAEEFEI